MAPRGIVAIVDPVSTGAWLALEIQNRGYKLVSVFSHEMTDDVRSHVSEGTKAVKYVDTITENQGEAVSSVAAKVKAVAAKAGLDLVACVVGGESGVTLTDALAEALKLPGNGTGIPNRRNKSAQQKLVKASGLRAVREACGKTWDEVKHFVETEPMPVVVKPVESAGSDGVKLVTTKQEAKEYFETLMKAQRKVGSQGAAVLIQEFLRGDEYVVDHVSLGGTHKTVAVWKYDKRPCNGSNFVYFGMLPVPSDSNIAKTIIEYTRGVLSALQFKQGASHGEVMWTRDGPCLVEMNCRCHGGDGAFLPLAQAITGYTQVSAAADSFLDHKAFAELPSVPPSPFLSAGNVVDIVSMQEGTIVSCPGFERIRKMKSFVSMEVSVHPGSNIGLTTDIFSQPASAVLVNKDANQLAADIAEIRRMELKCELFEVDAHGERLGRPRADSDLPQETKRRMSWEASSRKNSLESEEHVTNKMLLPSASTKRILDSIDSDEESSSQRTIAAGALSLTPASAVVTGLALFAAGALAGFAASKRR